MSVNAWNTVSLCPNIGDAAIANTVPTIVVILPTSTNW